LDLQCAGRTVQTKCGEPSNQNVDTISLADDYIILSISRKGFVILPSL